MKAARLNDLPHVLITGELNRANVPRALGELMFLLEYRSETIDLQFSQGFALPQNIAFIATMNTADKSIRSIDVALRRRFEITFFVADEMTPSKLRRAWQHKVSPLSRLDHMAGHPPSSPDRASSSQNNETSGAGVSWFG